jgi:formamidase
MSGATRWVQIDRTKPLASEPETGHNRWHPDIEPIISVRAGEVLALETRDALDGMISPKTKAEDLGRIEMGRIHPLTGPVYIDGTEPGDLLEVEIVEVHPQPFGFTLLIPGFGILRDYFPEPFIVAWDIAGNLATSTQLPGVKIPGAPFMGVMGVAPSIDLVEQVQSREENLYKRGGMVLLPTADGAVPSRGPVLASGLRTIPPRENGGNIDIRHLTAGAKASLNLFLGALARLGLARACVLQGDTDKGHAAYQDFLTLWKDADPDIPILKQAKAEYAKLQ